MLEQKYYAIKIDVVKKTVEKVDMTLFEGSSLAQIYKQLECDTVEAIGSIKPGSGDIIYLDEEGLRKSSKLGGFFLSPFDNDFFEKHRGPYIGHGLLVGIDDDGNDVDPDSLLEEIKERIIWIDKDDFENDPQLKAYCDQFLP